MRILTFMDFYLPGFKAGGPIRTVSAMVRHLPPTFEFRIVTRDRDHTEAESYPGVVAGQWTDVDGAKVLYLSRSMINIRKLAWLVRSQAPDVMYFNSVFSRITIRVLLARWLGWLGRVSVVLAPRGEFSAGALRFQRWQKRVFLALASRLGFFHRLVWQASSDVERTDILRALKATPEKRASRNIVVACDLVACNVDGQAGLASTKRPGTARFVFLSRVSPMKNLRMAIELVGALAGDVSLDIFGPIDDEKHGRECHEAASRARPNVKINWRGSVNPTEVAGVLAAFDFFVLPTLGENFGHVILEALGAGCPVVLSDRTPWKTLATDGAGWILPLEQPEQWREALQQCVEMDSATHQTMRQRAVDLALRCADQSQAIQQNIALFEEAASSRPL